MILEWLSDLILTIFTYVLSLFPDPDTAILTYIDSNVNNFKNYIAQTDWFFPVSSLFTVLGIVLSLELVFFAIRTVQWILAHVTLGHVKSKA